MSTRISKLQETCPDKNAKGDTIETRARRVISRAQAGPRGAIVGVPNSTAPHLLCYHHYLHPRGHYIPLPYSIPTSHLMSQPRYNSDGKHTARSELDVDYVDEAYALECNCPLFGILILCG